MGIRPHHFIFIMKALLIPILLISLTACQKAETDISNKATCLQAQQAIDNAKYQQEILEQQLVLAAVSEVKVNEAKQKKKELSAAMLIFDKVIENPDLNCSQYLK